MSFDDLAATIRRRARLAGAPATVARPSMLFIACSDPRVVPTAITGLAPAAVCELRTVGHRVPSYTDKCTAEAATVEYAVRSLGVTDIVVCGHSLCDVLDPTSEDRLPATRGWISAQGTESVPEDGLRDRIGRAPLSLRPDYSPDGLRFVGPRTVLREGDDRHRATYAHVLHQLGTLRTHPAVAEGLEDAGLALHAWFYDLVDRSVAAYQPGSATFVPL